MFELPREEPPRTTASARRARPRADKVRQRTDREPSTPPISCRLGLPEQGSKGGGRRQGTEAFELRRGHRLAAPPYAGRPRPARVHQRSCELASHAAEMVSLLRQ